jgi:hypothetical protein
MKDNRLEFRQNNFMKVSFDLLKTREEHNLSLRKTHLSNIINKNRARKPERIPTELELNQTELNIDESLKNYKVTNLVSSTIYQPRLKTLRKLKAIFQPKT